MSTYNTQQTLWDNYRIARKTLPGGGAPLSLHDGAVGNGFEVLARFETTRAAAAVLRRAGFSRDKTNGTWR